jgi:outer membrane protein
MKKIILTAVAVFVFSFANAQDKKVSGFGLSKGDVYAQGTVSFVSRSNGGNSTSLIAPSVGYFVTDNVSIQAQFLTSKTGPVKESAFGVGAAYHFNPKNQFSSQVFLSLGSGTETDVVDYKTTTIKLGYGVKYFVSSHFALVADLVGLDYTSRKVGNLDAVNTTTLGLNLSKISLGLAYKF